MARSLLEQLGEVALVRRIRNELASRAMRRRLRRVPRRSLAELEEDTLARMTGRARPFGAVLEAPLSGRACVYYAVAILEYRKTGHIRELASEQNAVPFVIDDDSHRAVIDPAYAQISAGFDYVSASFSARDASPRERALLARHGLKGAGDYRTKLLQYREAIIELDETIAVVGAGTREPDPDAAPTGAYRDGGPTRLRITGSARFPLVISDDPATLA